MSRNSSGIYSLYTPGNPVVTGTVISSTWANNSFSDLATALTDSLSRTGLGGMLAALQLDNGTIGTPGLNWGAETTAGLYRASAGNFRYAIGGVDVLTITASGISALNMTGSANPSATLGLTAVNGTATTFMRSDAAPALSQAITPTWTGNHTFASALPRMFLSNTSSGVDAKAWEFRIGATGTFSLIADTDAFGGALTPFSITRSGVASNPVMALDVVAVTNTGTYTQTANELRLNAAAPYVRWTESGAALNTKEWIAQTSGATWKLRLFNDAFSSAVDAFSVSRSAAALTDISFGNATNNPSYSFLGNGVATFGASPRLANDNAHVDFFNTANSVQSGYLSIRASASGELGTSVNQDFSFFTNNVTRLILDKGGGVYTNGATGGTQGSGTFNATGLYINGVQIFSGIPRSTTTTTLTLADRNKCVAITATINIPASTFSAGDAVSVYNDSAGALTITISAGTLRLAGTATTGTRTLAARGIATLWFNAGGATPEVIASGNVS